MCKVLPPGSICEPETFFSEVDAKIRQCSDFAARGENDCRGNVDLSNGSEWSGAGKGWRVYGIFLRMQRLQIDARYIVILPQRLFVTIKSLCLRSG